jgi:hypothetical protein
MLRTSHQNPWISIQVSNLPWYIAEYSYGQLISFLCQVAYFQGSILVVVKVT